MAYKLLISFLCLLILNNSFVTFIYVAQKQYYELNRIYYYYIKKLSYLLFKILLIVISLITFIYKVYYVSLPLILLSSFSNISLFKIKYSKRVIRLLILYNIISLSFIILLFNSFITQLVFILFIIHLPLTFITYMLSLILEKLILNHFKRKAINKLNLYKPKVIAISGSYGKTSVKNYIYKLLSSTYNVCVSKSSYNTLNGVLLTINNDLKPMHEILILEIGVDKKHGMDKFLSFLPINVGILTSIGPQHLKTFKTMENIVAEKQKLFTHLNASSTCIVNLDDKYIKNIKTKAHLITVSSLHQANIYFSDINYNLTNTTFTLNVKKEKLKGETSLLGKHNINNLLLSIATAIHFKIPLNVILNITKTIKNVEHRLSTFTYQSYFVIDDSYNSNIVGFLNALDVLNSSNNYKVLITPLIIESNDLINDKIIEIFDKINKTCDIVLFSKIIPSKYLKYLHIKYYSFSCFQEAFDYLKDKYKDQKLTILIENDAPDIYLR